MHNKSSLHILQCATVHNIKMEECWNGQAMGNISDYSITRSRFEYELWQRQEQKRRVEYDFFKNDKETFTIYHHGTLYKCTEYLNCVATKVTNRYWNILLIWESQQNRLIDRFALRNGVVRSTTHELTKKTEEALVYISNYYEFLYFKSKYRIFRYFLEKGIYIDVGIAPLIIYMHVYKTHVPVSLYREKKELEEVD